MPAVEYSLPVRPEGLDQDVLNAPVALVPRVEFAATLRLAQVDPVGGPIAGALEAWRCAEGFQQNRMQALPRVPIVGEVLQTRQVFGGTFRPLTAARLQRE